MKTLTIIILAAILTACGSGEDLPEAKVAAVYYNPSLITCAEAVEAGLKVECK